MSEFVQRLCLGTLPDRAVGITFDDGYIDNLLNAKAILRRYEIPATVFVVTGNLVRPCEYWWDELARLILLNQTEVDIAISVGADQMHIMLARQCRAEPRHPWRASEAPRTDREDVFLSVWKRLRLLDVRSRDAVMKQLRNIFKSDVSDPHDLPMSERDIYALIDDGAISIGAHSVTHPLLSNLPLGKREHEIWRSKKDCEALAGVPVEGFAYPYGDCDSATHKLVSAAGFRWACSTRSDRIDHTRFDLFELPRLQVYDWNSEEFSKLAGLT
jgi:peptidoglycan/xylan/chitin deacetylase (PgdA/CDA1 family)